MCAPGSRPVSISSHKAQAPCKMTPHPGINSIEFRRADRRSARIHPPAPQNCNFAKTTPHILQALRHLGLGVVCGRRMQSSTPPPRSQTFIHIIQKGVAVTGPPRHAPSDATAITRKNTCRPLATAVSSAAIGQGKTTPLRRPRWAGGRGAPEQDRSCLWCTSHQDQHAMLFGNGPTAMRHTGMLATRGGGRVAPRSIEFIHGRVSSSGENGQV